MVLEIPTKRGRGVTRARAGTRERANATRVCRRIRDARYSPFGDGRWYFIVVTASDNAAPLITAMRSHVEHPGGDRLGRSGKNTFPLDGLLHDSSGCFSLRAATKQSARSGNAPMRAASRTSKFVAPSRDLPIAARFREGKLDTRISI